MRFRNQDAPRLLADFILIQCAALLSLAVAMWIYLARHPLEGPSLIVYYQGFYLTTFLPISFLFPPIFLATGLYGRRRWRGLASWRPVMRSLGLATLTYVAIGFLISRGSYLTRSSMVVFFVLATAGMVGVRWFQAWIRSAEGSTSPAEHGPVLVVGGAGYIGSILCRNLLAAGERVRVLDSLLYGDAAIAGLRDDPNFELIVGDCRHIQSVVKAISGVKAVVHLAAIVGDPACDLDQRAALEVNYAATRMMAEVAKGYGVRRFVFASSCSVYGATDTLMDENSPVRPVSLYGHTKVDSERALLEAASDQFHPTVLRLATVFGDSYRPRFDLVVNLLTAKASTAGVITIFNGGQWRPFIHVRDAAAGFLQILQAPLERVSAEVFNLGDDALNCTLSGLAEQIRECCPATRVEHVENSDIRNYRVSFAKIRRAIGFRCVATLGDGITEIRDAVAQGRVADYEAPRYHNQRYLLKASAATVDAIDSGVMAAFAGESSARAAR